MPHEVPEGTAPAAEMLQLTKETMQTAIANTSIQLINVKGVNVILNQIDLVLNNKVSGTLHLWAKSVSLPCYRPTVFTL